MPQEFNTPVGRIVWGHPLKPRPKTDQKTKQPILKDGQPVQQWSFGLAIPKAEFNQFVMPYLQHEAATVYPHGTPANFSWKIKDGDGVDGQGKPYNTRDGYAGCYVLAIKTETFAPPTYKYENNRYRQLEANEIKCGDFVAVKLNVKANAPTDRTHTPGLYVNPMGVDFVGYGQEIISASADPDEMFGGRTYQLPPGATTIPQQAQTGVAAPAYGTAPAPAAAPAPVMTAPLPPQPPVNYAAPAPAPAAAAYLPPQAPVQHHAPAPAAYPPPAHDFVHNAGQPPAQPAAAPAPAYYPTPGHAPAPQAAPVAPAYNAPAPGGYPPAMPGIPPAGR